MEVGQHHVALNSSMMMIVVMETMGNISSGRCLELGS